MKRAVLYSALWSALACSQFAGLIPLNAASDLPGTGMYVDGIRAINEGRWKDAQKLFATVFVQQPEYADGALYWQAYAQNKQGDVKAALESCDRLRRQFPASKWIDECGALQIDIQSKTGNPLSPSNWTDDDLKLLAIASLMKVDEPKALADLQEILNGDGSEDLKKRAMFILGNHYSDETYAQIVRVRYVEGDVRVARGQQEEKLAGQDWEQAVADLPLETGFSLVTGGNGRAEIELEDASTLYLGENSVLLCNDLHTTAGTPYTEMALLSGTVSLAVKPWIVGEQLVLRTPTDNINVKYPQGASFRVNSYTDATVLTKQDAVAWHLTNSGDQIGDAKTVTLRGGHMVAGGAGEDAQSYAEFDKWVADRVAQRTAAMTEVMKAAGLTTPLPGLADMKGQGEFFSCPPYGTCWQPAGSEEPQQAKSELDFKPGEPRLVRASFTTPLFRSAQILDPLTDPYAGGFIDAFSPCYPTSLLYRTQRDPITGKLRVVDSGLGAAAGWGWAVCHAGGWVQQRRHHRYVWCVNQKRHHVSPIRWVKSDHKVGFVPLHPFDVKGKPPINRSGEVFILNDKHGLSVTRGRFEGGHPISVLNSPPHELRTTYLRPLAPVSAPHMEVRALKGPAGGEKIRSIRPVSTPLHFDGKTQSFMTSKEVMHGGRPVSVSAPISNHGGTLQARGDSFAGSHSGGFSGGGGIHGGGSSGGMHGGSGGGGASHGGGGGGGGGGGSHGGGGGGGSASSGASSGGGGGHH